MSVSELPQSTYNIDKDVAKGLEGILRLVKCFSTLLTNTNSKFFPDNLRSADQKDQKVSEYIEKPN